MLKPLLWRIIGACLMLISMVVSAQEKESICVGQPSSLVESVKTEISAMGRDAQFETNYITGGRTVPLYIRGANENLDYVAVAVRGAPDQHVKSNATSTVPDSTAEMKFIPVTITGIELLGRDTPKTLEDDRTKIYMQVPEVGLLWPAVTFYIAACPQSSEEEEKTPPVFVALVRVRVSAAWVAQVLAFIVVIALYTVAAVGVWHITTPPIALWRAFNPFRLTAGVFGQSSVSNLQIFTFTLIVLGLLVYTLMRTGELSAISANVAWLLGIVGAGTGASRLTASKSQKIEPANFSWILKRGWVKYDSTVSQLVTQGGEFSVTRFQSIVFSLVVAIALVISGSTDLATFVIPDSILGLLVASQAIYVGGKWVQPSEDKELVKTLNEALQEVRAAEDKLIQCIPPGTPQEKLKEAVESLGEDFEDYKKKAGKAANLIAVYIEVPMPDKGLFGIPLILKAEDYSKG